MNVLGKRPIKYQLMLVFIVFMTAILLVMAVTYHQSKRIIYTKNENYSREILDKLTQYIQSRMDNIDSVIKNTIYNKDMQMYLQVENVLDKIDLFQKADAQVAAISQVESGIVDITLIGTNGNNLNFMSDIHKRKAVMHTIEEISGLEERRATPYLASFTRIKEDENEHPFFIIGAEIKSVYPVETIGYMTMFLDLDVLFPKFGTMLQGGFGNFYVLDRNGIVCASNETAMIGKRLELSGYSSGADTKNIAQVSELPSIQGKVVNFYSEKELFRGLDRVRAMYLWILLLFIPFILFLLWVISRNVVNPIRSFMKFIRQKQINSVHQRQARLQLSGYHEITVMADRFNEMLDEIDRLTDEVVSSKTRLIALGLMKKQAELAYLKQQVNPHFLYNMLESLKGIASETGADEILDVVTALGKMLRYSIKGREHVSLGDELAVAEAYLMLQQFRFEGRFDVHIDVPEHLLGCRVIKMILQPILENAITHGLEGRMEKGNLWLEGRTTAKDDLILRVKDDGVGIGESMLGAIRRELHTEDDFLKRATDQEHVGIVNVHNRLRTIYGGTYGLTIASVPGEGTEVVLRIPMKEGESDV
ncbi:sensor histidine kinase [Paenibacillus sp. GCM10027626]|uniref:sensor histidine kinase n=1 Tax=Paenibacillus sp. GCM10027626 TaxID=3273411 RepID=UPI003632DB55